MRIIKILLGIVGTIIALVAILAVTFVISMQAEVPESRLDVRFDPAIQADPAGLPYLVFGGTRNTGLEVVKLLRGRGEKVTAFVRPTSNLDDLNAVGGVDYVYGDGLDAETVAAAVAAGPYQAVISTIGCFRCEPPPDFLANRNIVDAMVDEGGGYMMLITSIGAGDSAKSPPFLSRIILRGIIPLKDQAEEHLRASGLEYTIIRPGGLNNMPSTGNGMLTEDPNGFGFIYREDLAQMIVAAMDNRDKTAGKTLSAMDAERTSPWGEG